MPGSWKEMGRAGPGSSSRRKRGKRSGRKAGLTRGRPPGSESNSMAAGPTDRRRPGFASPPRPVPRDPACLA